MINVAVVVGRLTSDPELKKTSSGISVCSFTVACNRSYASKDGERQADFIDIIAWRNTADFICRYFKKGSAIGIEGTIQTRTYEDRNGVKRKAVEVIASNVSFVESKTSQSGKPSYATAPQAPDFESGNAEDFAVVSDDAFDEDLPF